MWSMKWGEPEKVVVARREPALSDEELSQKMAVLAENPVLVGVLEIVSRLEDRCLADASRADLATEIRLAGMNGYGVLQDLKVLIEKWRLAEEKGDR